MQRDGIRSFAQPQSKRHAAKPKQFFHSSARRLQKLHCRKEPTICRAIRRRSPSYVWGRQLSVEAGLPCNRVAGGFDLDLLPLVRDAHFIDVLQREEQNVVEKNQGIVRR
jgi:hypothetical protein